MRALLQRASCTAVKGSHTNALIVLYCNCLDLVGFDIKIRVAAAYFSTKTYPYHIVMGMPALSPTMSSGNLASWNVQVGSHFQAGDALARIETDKASIDFEAQDDGYVAKLLVAEGTPDINVGTPILVTVEEEEHVAAFANFTVEAGASTLTPAFAEAPAAAATSSPPPPPPPAPAAIAPAPVAPPVAVPAATLPPPVAPAPVAATPPPAALPSSPPTQAPSWGQSIHRTSPIAKTLSASQKSYIDKYGSTGQIPM